MSGPLEFTILGSGSSGGVPRADGNWGDCDPSEPKNHRSRCSLLVRRLNTEGEGGGGYGQQANQGVSCEMGCHTYFRK